MIVTMPDEIRDTIIECLNFEDEKPNLSEEQILKLKTARRLIDTTDSLTSEYLQLEKELRADLGNDWFSFALEIQ